MTDGANALIVGYGRFGQTVAQMLIASDVPVTLIDRDIEMIDIAASFGAKVYYGDGTRLDLLRQAGAAEAELILFCLDDDQITLELLESVHAAFPNASIFVRAYDRRAVLRLKGGPASYVVREVLESAVKMARLALGSLKVEAGRSTGSKPCTVRATRSGLPRRPRPEPCTRRSIGSSRRTSERAEPMGLVAILAALSGAIAIAAGAFGAHRAEGVAVEWLRTGGQYQLIHAVAAFVALRMEARGSPGPSSSGRRSSRAPSMLWPLARRAGSGRSPHRRHASHHRLALAGLDGSRLRTHAGLHLRLGMF